MPLIGRFPNSPGNTNLKFFNADYRLAQAISNLIHHGERLPSIEFEYGLFLIKNVSGNVCFAKLTTQFLHFEPQFLAVWLKIRYSLDDLNHSQNSWNCGPGCNGNLRNQLKRGLLSEL